MSEARIECYNCNYYEFCYERAVYNSKYCKFHIDVLGYGADDLYIREEIAELEDKLKELIEEE